MGQSNLIDESSSSGKEQLVCQSQRLSQPNGRVQARCGATSPATTHPTSRTSVQQELPPKLDNRWEFLSNAGLARCLLCTVLDFQGFVLYASKPFAQFP